LHIFYGKDIKISLRLENFSELGNKMHAGEEEVRRWLSQCPDRKFINKLVQESMLFGIRLTKEILKEKTAAEKRSTEITLSTKSNNDCLHNTKG
jgi:hypothetical protein